MNRWHAIIFAMVVLFAVDSLVGGPDKGGVLADAGETAARVAANKQSQSSVAAHPAPRQPSAWAASEVSETDPVIGVGNQPQIGDYSPAAAGWADSRSSRRVPNDRLGLVGSAPPMTVAGSPIPQPRRELIEG